MARSRAFMFLLLLLSAMGCATGSPVYQMPAEARVAREGELEVVGSTTPAPGSDVDKAIKETAEKNEKAVNASEAAGRSVTKLSTDIQKNPKKATPPPDPDKPDAPECKASQICQDIQSAKAALGSTMTAHGQALTIFEGAMTLAERLYLVKTDEGFKWWEAGLNTLALAGSVFAVSKTLSTDGANKTALLVGGGSLALKSVGDILLPVFKQAPGIKSLAQAVSENVAYSTALRVINTSIVGWRDYVTEKSDGLEDRVPKDFVKHSTTELLNNAQVVVDLLNGLAGGVIDAKAQLEDAQARVGEELLPDAKKDIEKLNRLARWIRSTDPKHRGIIFSLTTQRERLLLAKADYDRAVAAASKTDQPEQ